MFLAVHLTQRAVILSEVSTISISACTKIWKAFAKSFYREMEVLSQTDQKGERAGGILFRTYEGRVLRILERDSRVAPEVWNETFTPGSSYPSPSPIWFSPEKSGGIQLILKRL